MILAEHSREEILAELRAAFRELFEIPEDDVQPAAHLFEDLDLDSLDAADMRARLQELLGRSVPEGAFQDVRTVDDVLRLVQRLAREA